jgi:hypothetical protein
MASKVVCGIQRDVVLYIKEFVQSHQSNWWLLSPAHREVVQRELATMQFSLQGQYMVSRRPREIVLVVEIK